MKHKIFLDDFASNAAALEARYGIIGWRVICGDCGTVLAGAVKDSGRTVSVRWTYDGSSWFGKFEEDV